MAGAGARTRKDGTPSAKVGSIEVLHPKRLGPGMPTMREVRTLGAAAEAGPRTGKRAEDLVARAASARAARTAFMAARRGERERVGAAASAAKAAAAAPVKGAEWNKKTLTPAHEAALSRYENTGHGAKAARRNGASALKSADHNVKEARAHLTSAEEHDARAAKFESEAATFRKIVNAPENQRANGSGMLNSAHREAMKASPNGALNAEQMARDSRSNAARERTHAAERLADAERSMGHAQKDHEHARLVDEAQHAHDWNKALPLTRRTMKEPEGPAADTAARDAVRAKIAETYARAERVGAKGEAEIAKPGARPSYTEIRAHLDAAGLKRGPGSSRREAIFHTREALAHVRDARIARRLAANVEGQAKQLDKGNLFDKGKAKQLRENTVKMHRIDEKIALDKARASRAKAQEGRAQAIKGEKVLPAHIKAEIAAGNVKEVKMMGGPSKRDAIKPIPAAYKAPPPSKAYVAPAQNPRTAATKLGKGGTVEILTRDGKVSTPSIAHAAGIHVTPTANRGEYNLTDAKSGMALRTGMSKDHAIAMLKGMASGRGVDRLLGTDRIQKHRALVAFQRLNRIVEGRATAAAAQRKASRSAAMATP